MKLVYVGLEDSEGWWLSVVVQNTEGTMLHSQHFLVLVVQSQCLAAAEHGSPAQIPPLLTHLEDNACNCGPGFDWHRKFYTGLLQHFISI